MGSVIDLTGIRNTRLTNIGPDSDLAYLKANGPRALPSSPSANDWTAEAIKKQFYKQPEILFDWMKKGSDATIDALAQVDGYIKATASINFRLSSEIEGIIEIEDE